MTTEAVTSVIIAAMLAVLASACATFAWGFSARAKVLRNTRCISFHDIKVVHFPGLAFWRSALTVQRRCAQNGHTATCLRCGHFSRCSGVRCDSCGFMTDIEELKGYLFVVSRSMGSEVIRSIRAAVAQTETMEDVMTLFSDTEGTLQPKNTQIMRASSAFHLRCFELTKKEYKGLPFAVKWEFAQQRAESELVEHERRTR